MKEKELDPYEDIFSPDLSKVSTENSKRNAIKELEIKISIQEYLNFLSELTPELSSALRSWIPDDPKQAEKEKVRAKNKKHEREITRAILRYLEDSTLQVTEEFLSETFKFEDLESFREEVNDWTSYRDILVDPYYSPNNQLTAKKALLNEVLEIVASLESIPPEYARDLLKKDILKLAHSFSPEVLPETLQRIKDALWQLEEKEK